MLLGSLYVISAPSGAGKTSLVKAMVESTPHMKVSISYTTRTLRTGEQDGTNYHHVTESQFLELIEKDTFIEYAKVFNNYYGTSKTWVSEQLESGEDVILEIDWQGAKQVKQIFPHAKSIFILPPNLDALKQRLMGRGRDDKNEIDYRMSQAISEMSHYVDFDYTIINDEFDLALRDMQTIIRSQRLSTKWLYKHKKTLIDNLFVGYP